ncbi:peptide deformylase [Rickettsiales endosymbiont of Stachyamoeba lipophora]|uniref:peptide deformylase n=1 Tax=Rickettsiales endosymbiont of Stachyamoeba lipophora TaxID=2486578 RepID=UPI000F650689|nr:peptide deformylase [Rickettsiales endosymbiont of Stachyamoeba lipophora]AZL16141.1 peptide deformylase [Rickettsiales endosymbiont of Stachyamoeba lipophora]
MAILPIVTIPDPRLKQKAEIITEITDEIKQLAQDMIETMYHGRGMGLAGNQVGVLKRIIIVDISEEEGKPNPIVMINPAIIKFSEDKVDANEGCLSIPGHYPSIIRHQSVTTTYLDLDGNKQTIETTEYIARCIQHEIDHLNGIVSVDYISPLKRNMIIEKVRKKNLK